MRKIYYEEKKKFKIALACKNESQNILRKIDGSVKHAPMDT